MKKYFFPRDKIFWAYQISAQVLFVVVQIVVDLVVSQDGGIVEHQAVGLLVWNLLLILSVLIYRAIYNAWSWSDYPTIELFGKSLLMVVALSAAMTLIISIITIPIYWDEMLAHEQLKNSDVTLQEFIKIYLVSNFFGSAFVNLAWAFIYIGITNARKAKQSQLDNLQLQNSLKEAQLSSLSNQLNPHFLFNSLNNIRFMIHENAEQADNMITALSEVLRYSLESSQHQKLPLSKEIEIIQKYVAIVAIQFEDRLNFEMNIPASMHDISIPPMLLQMLIENAVKHGLEQIQHGGSIALSAEAVNGVINFTISNDIPSSPQFNNANTGIGLKNIEQRLSLIYGGNASINKNEAGGKYVVNISLPIEKNQIEGTQ